MTRKSGWMLAKSNVLFDVHLLLDTHKNAYYIWKISISLFLSLSKFVSFGLMPIFVQTKKQHCLWFMIHEQSSANLTMSQWQRRQWWRRRWWQRCVLISMTNHLPTFFLFVLLWQLIRSRLILLSNYHKINPFENFEHAKKERENRINK